MAPVMRPIPRLAAAVVALALLSPAPAAVAQAPPTLDPTGRSGEPPPLREERPAPPPVPPLSPLPPAPVIVPRLLPSVRIHLRGVRVTGSTVLAERDVAAIAAPYLDRAVTSEDLEALRLALTRAYVERGYVTSGALLPDQAVEDGVVTFRVVEGRLSGIDVEGTRGFREGWLRRRVRLGADTPLDVNALQRSLQLLQQDPRIERLDAELSPGLQPGDAVLALRVQERRPYHLIYEFNNYQSPSIGAARSVWGLEHDNLTGNGDVLTARYGTSEGLDRQLDLRYALPVTPWDTTVALQYRDTAFTIVDPTFRELDIQSKTEIYTASIRHPVYRTLGREVALELIGERLTTQTTLLGERFSLTPGARTGETTVAALRFAQEWLDRSERYVIAFRSRLSWGLDVLDATVNPLNEAGDPQNATARRRRIPDGRFFAWLGQVQWVQRLPWDVQSILRTDLQLANDALFPVEQIALGGRYTVRGYRENTLVRDNGVVVSLELRVPIVQRRAWADTLELAPFLDYGRGWDFNPPPPDPGKLLSAGIGLRWAATLPLLNVRPSFEIYWGRPLVRAPAQAHPDLQDQGVHLQARVAVF
jgi:hemolysin activation/secretion protein